MSFKNSNRIPFCIPYSNRKVIGTATEKVSPNCETAHSARVSFENSNTVNSSLLINTHKWVLHEVLKKHSRQVVLVTKSSTYIREQTRGIQVSKTPSSSCPQWYRFMGDDQTTQVMFKGTPLLCRDGRAPTHQMYQQNCSTVDPGCIESPSQAFREQGKSCAVIRLIQSNLRK